MGWKKKWEERYFAEQTLWQIEFIEHLLHTQRAEFVRKLKTLKHFPADINYLIDKYERKD